MDSKTIMEQARGRFREWGLDRLPAHFQRNGLDYYYLSVWPGLRNLQPAGTLPFPPRPGPISYAYIHIPFCSGVCDFCSYFLTVTRDAGRDERINEYIELLIEQVKIQQRECEISLSQIYLGGGTPSILTPGQINRLFSGMDGLGALASPRIGTTELHPEIFESTDRLDAVLDALWSHQIRRVSIGYQTSDEKLLDASNRRHGGRFLAFASDLLRRRGFLVNIDLMYGLPGQTTASWLETLRSALDVRPDSISTYFTFIDYGTTIWARVMRDRSLLPAHELVQLCHIASQILLEDRGFTELPNDFWAIPDCDPLEFEQTELPSTSNTLALGAGAYGYYSGVQYFNEFTIEGYRRAIVSRKTPIWRAGVLGPLDDMRRDVMFSLKNAPHLRPSLFIERYGVSPIDVWVEQFDELISLDLVEMTSDIIRLTPKGRLVVEEIACRFDAQLPYGPTTSRLDAYLVRKHHYAPTYSRLG